MCSFCGIPRGNKRETLDPPKRHEGFSLTNQKNYSPRPFLGAAPLERELELFLLVVPLDLDGVLLRLETVLLLLFEGALRFTALLLLFDEELRFTELLLLLVVLPLEDVDFLVVVCLFTELFLVFPKRFDTELLPLDFVTEPLLEDPTLLELPDRLMSLDAFPLLAVPFVVLLLLTELLPLLAMSFRPKLELLFLLATPLVVFLDTDELLFTFRLELLRELMLLLLLSPDLLTAVFLLLAL
jgi:hypothetical protein